MGRSTRGAALDAAGRTLRESDRRYARLIVTSCLTVPLCSYSQTTADVFALLGASQGDLEYPDVEAGVYEAVYTIDGRVVELSTRGRDVVAVVTETRDEASLRRRLEAVPRLRLTRESDLIVTANLLLRERWEVRWPKRPRWLANRLHGAGPPEVS